MANDMIVDGRSFAEISRIDGIVLISFFIIFVYYVFGVSKVSAVDRFKTKLVEYKLPKSIITIVGGTIGLAFGGQMIIESATKIASSFNISEGIIGLTIVALGTSLPELATSATAAYKKDVDIAIGNVVGSNIFNLFWVLGVTAIIRPLIFSPKLLIDVIITALAALALFMVMILGKKPRTMERWEGILFVLLYIAYIIFLVFRASA